MLYPKIWHRHVFRLLQPQEIGVGVGGAGGATEYLAFSVHIESPDSGVTEKHLFLKLTRSQMPQQ